MSGCLTSMRPPSVKHGETREPPGGSGLGAAGSSPIAAFLRRALVEKRPPAPDTIPLSQSGFQVSWTTFKMTTAP